MEARQEYLTPPCSLVQLDDGPLSWGNWSGEVPRLLLFGEFIVAFAFAYCSKEKESVLKILRFRSISGDWDNWTKNEYAEMFSRCFLSLYTLLFIQILEALEGLSLLLARR